MERITSKKKKGKRSNISLTDRYVEKMNIKKKKKKTDLPLSYLWTINE